jgi:hypothetical protein
MLAILAQNFPQQKTINFFYFTKLNFCRLRKGKMANLSVSDIPIVPGLVRINAGIVSTEKIMYNEEDDVWFAFGYQTAKWASIFRINTNKNIQKVWFRYSPNITCGQPEMGRHHDMDYHLIAVKFTDNSMNLVNPRKFENLKANDGLISLDGQFPCCLYDNTHKITCQQLDSEISEEEDATPEEWFEKNKGSNFFQVEKKIMDDKKFDSTNYLEYLEFVEEVLSARDITPIESYDFCRTRKGKALLCQTDTTEIRGFRLWSRIGCFEFVNILNQEDVEVTFMQDTGRTISAVWMFELEDVKIFYGFHGKIKFLGKILRSSSIFDR